jgi:aspartokinase-like uncharacterized kinase
LKPVVVKIGGSVLTSGRLGKVLDAVAKAKRAVVIVTGGGPFADAVRETQKRLKYSDLAAHRMAILAMHQTAEIVLPASDRFVAVETPGDIRRVHDDGKAGVWLPARMAASDRTLATDWSVTSDALAARLAERIGADVVLVKSCAVAAGRSADDLAAEGIVDPAFPQIVARAGMAWHVLSSDDLARLTRILSRTTAKKAIRRVRQTMLSREKAKRS